MEDEIYVPIKAILIISKCKRLNWSVIQWNFNKCKNADSLKDNRKTVRKPIRKKKKNKKKTDL